jgi:hypothetical protein
VPGHVKSITTTNISHWNTAHSWGDHAQAGYATINGHIVHNQGTQLSGQSTNLDVSGNDIEARGVSLGTQIRSIDGVFKRMTASGAGDHGEKTVVEADRQLNITSEFVLTGSAAGGSTEIRLEEDGELVLINPAGNYAPRAVGGLTHVVVQETKLLTEIIASGTSKMIDDLKVSIMPASSNSRFLVDITIQADSTDEVAFTVYRKKLLQQSVVGTLPQVGNAGHVAHFGGKPNGVSAYNYKIIDSPATMDLLEYMVEVEPIGTSSAYINRAATESSTTGRYTSTITVTELAQ